MTATLLEPLIRTVCCFKSKILNKTIDLWFNSFIQESKNKEYSSVVCVINDSQVRVHFAQVFIVSFLIINY